MQRDEMISELLWNTGGDGWGICPIGAMLIAKSTATEIKSPVLIGGDGTGNEFTDEELLALVNISQERAAWHRGMLGSILSSDNLITIRKYGPRWTVTKRSWECGPICCDSLAELAERVKKL